MKLKSALQFTIILLGLSLPTTALAGSPAARHRDRTSTGATIYQGSSNVYINGKMATRYGHKAYGGTATYLPGGSYYGSIYTGSSTVRINGSRAARVSDRVIQGVVTSNIITGSGNVFIGN